MMFNRMFLAAGAAGLMLAGPVFGHAKLTSSSPAAEAQLESAPKSLTLTFNEKVKLAVLTLLLDGKTIPVSVDRSAVAVAQVTLVLPVLMAGKYHVQWSALSVDDGHVSKGGFAFTVAGSLGRQSLKATVAFSAWDAALIALKAITYGGTLSAAGAVFFLSYCDSCIDGAARRAILQLVRVSGIVAVVAGAAHVVVTAGSMSDNAAGMVDGRLLHMVWSAGEGRAVGIRSLGLVLVVLVEAWPRPRAEWAIGGAVLAATSFAWVGHAHSLSSSVAPTLMLSVHLLSVAFWLGALTPLLIVSCARDAARIAAAVQRFSAAATGVVAALLVAGVALARTFLGEISQLWLSPYGRYLLIKLAVVAALLSCAAFNKWRLTPRLRRNEAGAVQRLNASIRLERLLGVLILTTTAALTTLVGPAVLE